MYLIIIESKSSNMVESFHSEIPYEIGSPLKWEFQDSNIEWIVKDSISCETTDNSIKQDLSTLRDLDKYKNQTNYWNNLVPLKSLFDYLKSKGFGIAESHVIIDSLLLAGARFNNLEDFKSYIKGEFD